MAPVRNASAMAAAHERISPADRDAYIEELMQGDDVVLLEHGAYAVLVTRDDRRTGSCIWCKRCASSTCGLCKMRPL